LLPQSELEELVRKPVLLYNRYRSPEAIVKIENVTAENVTIAFTGSFCYSCGVIDYLEDFVHEFKMLTDKAELKIGKTREINPRSFEANYRVEYR
jgi:hypothetical protein